MSRFVYFLREEKVSWRGVTMPCMIPIMVLSPRLASNRKMMMAQKVDPENTEMISVNATMATPGPSITCDGMKGKSSELTLWNLNCIPVPSPRKQSIAPLIDIVKLIWP